MIEFWSSHLLTQHAAGASPRKLRFILVVFNTQLIESSFLKSENHCILGEGAFPRPRGGVGALEADEVARLRTMRSFFILELVGVLIRKRLGGRVLLGVGKVGCAFGVW